MVTLRATWPAGLALAATLACGGGAPGPADTSAHLGGFAYPSPGDPGQWRLVRSASSTPDRLVLDLMAPTGASGMGVVLDLRVDPARAAWEPALAGAGAYAAPLVKVSPAAGELRVLLSQANPAPPVAYGTAPVLSLALGRVPGAPGGDAALAVVMAGHLPDRQARPEAIHVAVGSLAIP